jgi:AraC family transcriptional regulator of adaptative response/methylated-DNA-[protein]-cysteine methyltransferase
MTREQQTDDSRWSAVLGRDARSDGGFVYAVASTRVYCRPSCPSRRPKRRQVRFFPDPDMAEAAGYRACRRCQPRDPLAGAPGRIQRAREYLESHLDETVTLERLGRVVGMSPYHLQRTFKRLTGMTPRVYSGTRRLERLKSRLKEGKTVTRATFDAGFASASRAYAHSRARLGMTPATYRNGARGVRIGYTVVSTPFGALLVAATERGVCSVALGDSAPELEAQLRREFPAAELERGDGSFRAWTEVVVNRLTGEGAETRIPLDVSGTAFQWRVWEALQQIPRGDTRSYGEIAREVGRPSAGRAVARACATNPVALLIPCHRAVRGDGEVGGYRWGMERKKSFLKVESGK